MFIYLNLLLAEKTLKKISLFVKFKIVSSLIFLRIQCMKIIMKLICDILPFFGFSFSTLAKENNFFDEAKQLYEQEKI